MASAVIDGVAETSKVYFQWRFYLSIVIAVIMVIAGAYLVLRKDKETEEVTGTVQDQVCGPSGRHGRECRVRVSYKAGGRDLTNTITTSALHMKGDNITLYVNPNNPMDVSTMSPKMWKWIGFGLSGCAVVVVALSYLVYWGAQKNKGFATFMGVSQLVGSNSSW